MIAMKSAGLKITSIIRPIVFLGFLIGIIAFLVSDRLAPVTSRFSRDIRQINFEKNEKEKKEDAEEGEKG